MCQYLKEYAGAVGVVLQPRSLNVILDRPWVMRRLDVLEIVAPVHLRTSLSLVDGDRVVIEVLQ